MTANHSAGELSGKTAVVTGAGSGIGRGIALCLAEAGASVVIADVNERAGNSCAAELRKLGVGSLAVQVDVRRSADVRRMLRATLREFGGIDILVNNAGISGFSALWQLPEREWDDVFAVNAKGTFLCTKSVAPEMMRRKSGKIINVASISGMVSKFLNQSHYCASKAAVISFTRAAALELAPYHINVNAVCPGVTVSEQTRGLLEDSEQRRQILEMVPLERLGQPENIGALVAFLAGPRSDFMTGSIVVADGGLTAR